MDQAVRPGREPLLKRPGTVAALGRVRRALLPALAFAIPFGLAVAASVAGRMILAEQAVGQRFVTMVLAMLAAATVAGGVAWLAAAAAAGHRVASVRAAAMLIALVAATAGSITLAQIVAFRLDDGLPGSHREFPSVLWFLNVIGSVASSAYLTVAVALRLVLPAGLLPLLAGMLLFARYGADRRG